MPDPKATYPAEITLVPNSGVQFVTLPFSTTDVTNFDRTFIERRFSERDMRGTEVDVRRLLQGWNSRSPNEAPPNEPVGDDDPYGISKDRALEPFIGKWVPVPYLCVSTPATALNPAILMDGPTNWVRVRITKAHEGEVGDGPTHIAVFAFDTLIEDYEPPPHRPEPGEPERPYVPHTEPRKRDLTQAFHFVSDMNSLDRILADPRQSRITGDITDHQAWLVEWLKQSFIEFMKAKKAPRPLNPAVDLPHQLEHVSRWIAMLDLLRLAASPPVIRFIDTLSDQSTHVPVDVDLILDVGNSRTCGMLIEDFPNDADMPGISNAMTLALRDLSEPERTYGEPFDSHIEFSQANFGDYGLSRLSGRDFAFFWPSMVRVGKEATRLRNQQDDGNESLCGMSSPKRYLWDVTEAVQPWRFQRSDYIDENVLPPTLARTRTHVNSRGDVLSQVQKDNSLFEKLYEGRPRDWKLPGPLFTYSRSSMYTFMLAELIWQAFVSINSPEVRALRKQSGVPRRLRRVILTLPTAMPSREQRIMRARAQSAINLLWELMGWSKSPPRGTEKPIVDVMWDEASCGQMVWLYGEIAEKFGGIEAFFDLMGRPRLPFTADTPPAPGAREETSLRIASVDIGGGTTDLMITTYFQQDNLAIRPVQTFRESMRVAGDEVVKAVIETVLFPAIAAHLREAGASDPLTILRELFRGDGANISVQQGNRRRQFVHRVLQPAALSVMSAYEDMNASDYGTVERRPLADLVADFADVPAATLDYLGGAAQRATGVPLELGQIAVPLDFGQVREATKHALGPVLDNMCEAINHFDCDVVLLTGRPSRLPSIVDLIADALAVPPDRIVPMHLYQPGHWYPFLSRQDARITDPKTTAVVGGTLCAMADRRIKNFMVYTDAFQMRSTARFIGQLETNGMLKAEKVLFSEAELNDPKLASQPKSLPYYSRLTIGYRQLPFERWTATPLYELNETRGGNPIPKPVKVTLARSEVEREVDPDLDSRRAQDAIFKRESAREELRIEEAETPTGSPVAASMTLSLRTLDANTNYWLDTGILNV